MLINIIAKGGLVEYEEDNELTPKRIKLIQDTWQAAMGLGEETVGVLLFKNIFTAAP